MLKNYVTSLNSVLRDSKMVVSGVRFVLFLRLLNVFLFSRHTSALTYTA